MVVAILQLGLEVSGKTVAERSVDPPGGIIPTLLSVRIVLHLPEELLVPAQGAEKARGDFVFCFQVAGQRVGIPGVRHLESRGEHLPPELQAMPGIADIGANSALQIITSLPAGRETG